MEQKVVIFTKWSVYKIRDRIQDLYKEQWRIESHSIKWLWLNRGSGMLVFGRESK